MSELKRYVVNGEVTISIQCVVAATSEEAAKAAAAEAGMQQFCHSCSESGDPANPEWRSTGELDGEPRINGVEEDEDE